MLNQIILVFTSKNINQASDSFIRFFNFGGLLVGSCYSKRLNCTGGLGFWWGFMRDGSFSKL